MSDPVDEYEEYNYDESLHGAGQARKGKTKKEASQNKNVSHHFGQTERKVAENIQHGEDKRKEEALRKQQAQKEK